MNFTGWWADPTHKGEGLMIYQTKAGSYAGCYYAPDDGNGEQLWLVCTGDVAEDGGLEFQVGRVRAGGEKPWGEISIIPNGESILLGFGPLESPFGARVMYRHPAIEHGGIEPDQPTGPAIAIQKKVGNRWIDLDSFPLTGRTNPDNEHRLVFNVTDRITAAYTREADFCRGKYNPQIRLRNVATNRAVSIFDVVLAGDVIEVTYAMSGDWEQGDGQYKWGVWFAVETEKAGKVIDLAVQVKD